MSDSIAWTSVAETGERKPNSRKYKKMWCTRFTLLVSCVLTLSADGMRQSQYGPDPWDVPENHVPDTAVPLHEPDRIVPPDILMSTSGQCNSNEQTVGDWFFKRLLVIILKNGSLKTQDDKSKEISVMMKLPPDQWNLLEEYINTDKPLTEEMYRRIVGYISEGIYRPTFTEKVAQAWTEYVMSYYEAYRDVITWIFTIVVFLISIVIMSKFMPRKVLLTVLFVLLYVYEGFISFKEFEKQEYDKFTTAMSRCSWRFWSSSCNVQMSDPLVFWKHMHPAKICIRMCAHLITEPLLLVSSSVNQISDDITRDLVFPFSTIARGVLILFLNTICIVLVIMMVCTFILNIPLNVGIAGIINFGINRRIARADATQYNNAGNIAAGNDDRIGGENLRVLLNVLANQANQPQRQNVNLIEPQQRHNFVGEDPRRRVRNRDRPALEPRSRSAGRLG